MAEQSISKRCSTCKQIKPISEFCKSCGTKDGHDHRCKMCHGKQNKKYRRTEKGQVYQKNYQKHYRKTEKAKAAQKRYHRKWYYEKNGQKVRKVYEQSNEGKVAREHAKHNYGKRHPNRLKARRAVAETIKTGRLPRLDTLQCACGKQAKQYHHHKGYEPKFWLDVIPVCAKCHTKASSRL